MELSNKTNINVPVFLCFWLFTLVGGSQEVHDNENNQAILLRDGKRHHRSLFLDNLIDNLPCLGIFVDCDKEDDSPSDEGTETTLEEEEDGDDGSFCLGLFYDCDDDKSDIGGGLVGDIWCAITGDCTESGYNSTTTTVNCTEVDGIFGGRPLFGACGRINDIFNVTDNDEDGSIVDDLLDSLELFPEGSLLGQIFNRADDVSIIDSILSTFRSTTNQFSTGFLEEWSASALSTNQTCVNTVDAPTCLDIEGNEGFWVCRTLTNPFTGIPSSRNLCIGEGSFLDGNDDCGCCEEAYNVTASIPTCPAVCPCACDNEGIDDGVWITVSADVLGANATLTDQCVDPRWAVSMTSRFESISCLETCP